MFNLGSLFLLLSPLLLTVQVHAETSRSLTCPVILPQDPPSELSNSLNAFNIPTSSPNRIINGDLASQSLQEYLVSVLITPSEGFFYLCTGTMISATQFVTAAHCYDPGAVIYASIGYPRSLGYDPDQERILVAKMEVHPGYSAGNGINDDIAVGTLSERVQSPVKFMKINVNPLNPPVESFVRAVGYGTTENDPARESPEEAGFLRQVDVPVTSEEECQDAYDNIVGVIDYDIHTCAGYRGGGCDSCQGDSGGPIIQYNANNEPVMVGITSFGFECARPGFPGVYVRTSGYEAWLDKINAKYTKDRDVVPVYGAGTAPTEPSPKPPVDTQTIMPQTSPPPDEDGDGDDNQSFSAGITSGDIPTVIIAAVGALAAALLLAGIFSVIVVSARRARSQTLQSEGDVQNNAGESEANIP